MNNYYAVKSTKSVGLGIILTLFLGPIGLFYGSVMGGLIMTFGPLLILGVLFFGAFLESEFLLAAGFFVLIIYAVLWWLICMIWSTISIKKYNRKIIRESVYETNYYPLENQNLSQNTINQSYQLNTNTLNISSGTTISQQNSDMKSWFEENPGKSLNDYYATLRK